MNRDPRTTMRYDHARRSVDPRNEHERDQQNPYDRQSVLARSTGVTVQHLLDTLDRLCVDDARVIDDFVLSNDPNLS